MRDSDSNFFLGNKKHVFVPSAHVHAVNTRAHRCTLRSRPSARTCVCGNAPRARQEQATCVLQPDVNRNVTCRNVVAARDVPPPFFLFLPFVQNLMPSLRPRSITDHRCLRVSSEKCPQGFVSAFGHTRQRHPTE